ncbi:hypothetical protein [Thalassobellus citreus]|uniref:hypothetical protein n=1 Tax=Thalassobellus citreus TaxID=3367752 RepID=UPI00378FDF44
MHKELILEAFKKANVNRARLGEKNPSLISKAKLLSDAVHLEAGFVLGERSFRNYYNKAKEIYSTDEDINIKQFKVILGLCKYLQYENYEDFISKINFEKSKHRGENKDRIKSFFLSLFSLKKRRRHYI